MWAEAVAAGYTSDRWLTYEQAAEMGGQVRKGERSVTGVFFKTLARAAQRENDDTGTSESFRIIKPFWLFNLDQIDGIEPPQAMEALIEFQHPPSVCAAPWRLLELAPPASERRIPVLEQQG